MTPTPTPKSLDEILEKLTADLDNMDSRGYPNMSFEQAERWIKNRKAEARTAINQLCLSEFLKLVGQDEHSGEWDDENGVPEELTILENDVRNQLRADLRTKALDRWSRSE